MARKFGTREIVIVQSLIEPCLTFYATKEEVMEILEKKCGIDEVISSVIWDKLEKENEEFFKEYYKRLKMKERIEAFNEEICTYATNYWDYSNRGRRGGRKRRQEHDEQR